MNKQPARETLDRAMSEKDFQAQVIELAKLRGWRVYKTWSSMHSPAGYPDLCMVRLSRIVYAELKSEKGKASPAQQEWLDDLEGAGKVEVYLWRPSAWYQIENILR